MLRKPENPWRVSLVTHSLSAIALALLLGSCAAGASGSVEIRVLSGRAGMVTGGDALVETNAAGKIQRYAEWPGHFQGFPSRQSGGDSYGARARPENRQECSRNQVGQGLREAGAHRLSHHGAGLFGTASEAVRVPDGTGGPGRAAR